MDKVCTCGQPSRKVGKKCEGCYRDYMRDYMRNYNKQNKRAQKDRYMRKRYNFTVEQYEAMLVEQNGQCAICGTTEPGQTEWFEVDHNHACCDKRESCGACVRGLLCTGCNTGISRFKDDPDKLEAAAAYVRARSINARNES